MIDAESAVSKPDVMGFFTELAEQFCGGQPMLPSLRRIESGLADQPMAAVVRDLADSIEGGATLSDAMAEHPAIYDEAVMALVRAGEIAGVLDHILVLIVECNWRYPGRMVQDLHPSAPRGT